MPLTVELTLDNGERIPLSFPLLDEHVSEAVSVPWREYLETRTDLLEEANGVRWYCRTNCHYVVHHGHVHRVHGYAGRVLYHFLAYARRVFDLADWHEWSPRFYRPPVCLPPLPATPEEAAGDPLLLLHLAMAAVGEEQRREEAEALARGDAGVEDMAALRAFLHRRDAGDVHV